MVNVVPCLPKCKESDGQTTVSLDEDTDAVVCDICNKEFNNMSKFFKNSLKQNKVLKKKLPSQFMSRCMTCNKEKGIVYSSENGKDCYRGDGCDKKECKFNITEGFKNLIKNKNSGEEI